MKQKKAQDIGEWIEKTSEKLIEIYQLGAITVYYKKATKEMQERSKGLIFSVRSNIRYRTATIYYYDLTEEFYKDKEINILAKSLMHEFSHVVLEPLAELSESRYITEKELADAIDNVTEHFTIIIKDLLDKTEDSIIK